MIQQSFRKFWSTRCKVKSKSAVIFRRKLRHCLVKRSVGSGIHYRSNAREHLERAQSKIEERVNDGVKGFRLKSQSRVYHRDSAMAFMAKQRKK